MKLEDIEKLLTEISPWPWSSKKDQQARDWHEVWSLNNPGMDVARLPPWSNYVEANAGFIAAAPQIIRDLLDRLKIAEEALDYVVRSHFNDSEYQYDIIDGAAYDDCVEALSKIRGEKRGE